MAQIETWLRTDLKHTVRVQPIDGNLFSADNGANRVGVILTNNGQSVNITGGISGYFIRSDEATVVISGSSSGNRGWVDLPASAYVKTGPFSLVIKNGTTTLGACTGYVYRSSTDEIVDPGHVIPSLEELLDEIENMRAATSAATDATAKINNMTVAASGLAAGAAPTVTISEVSGHKHIAFGIPKGDKGEKGATGSQGPKGDAGKDFHIKRTFSSIMAMEAYDPSQDQSQYKVLENDFVMIDTGSVQDADTGKLYCYEPSAQLVWRYIGDLSGSQGIQGPKGDPGEVTEAELQAVADAKANVITESITAPASVQSFSDGADNLPMEITIGLEPVQDLHGYDSPWVGGAGNNIMPVPLTYGKYIDSETGNTGKATMQKYCFTDYIPVNPGDVLFFGQNDATASIAGLAFYSTKEVSGYVSGLTWSQLASKSNVVTVPEGAYFLRNSFNKDFNPNPETECYITLNSNPHVWSPYENICPISGWTGCNVTRTGKNLYDKSATNTDNGYEDGKVLKSTGNAEAPSSPQYWCISEYIRVEPSTMYTISGMRDLSASGTVYCCQYDENKNFVQSVDQSFASITFTTGSNVKFMRLTTEKSQMATVQIEKGLVTSAYEPFGDVYSITFPAKAGTVYGGTLKVNKDGTGSLTVGWAEQTITDITEFDTTLGGKNLKRYDYTTDIRSDTNAIAKAERLQSTTYNLRGASWSIYPASSRRVNIVSDVGTTVEEFNEKLSGSKFIYELDTPIAYTIPATVIRSLLGTNNIWCDTGNVLNIEYSADTKTYIDNLFSSIVNATGVSF